MPYKLLFPFFIMLNCIYLLAYENYEVGAKSAAMGETSVMIPDLWSVHHNQGGMAFYNKPAFGIHHENRFLIPQYAYQSAVITIPVKFGVFGINYSYFGYKIYNDKKIGLGFSKKLIEKLAVGIQMDLISTYLSEFGNENKICAEIGILAEPLNNLFIGTHVFNPFRNNYKEMAPYDIPTIFRIGAGYMFDETLIFATEVEKDINEKPVYKGGLDYNILYGLHIRLGIHSNPSQYSFGLGYIYHNVMADISFVSHMELGFTPHFSINYEFK